jgi:hypothetical protein
VPRNHATQGDICHQDGAIVAMTHRDDIHTHDIAFDRSDFDPVEHRVSRFLGNTCQQRFESGQKTIGLNVPL